MGKQVMVTGAHYTILSSFVYLKGLHNKKFGCVFRLNDAVDCHFATNDL
jgi:hypothetical protein